MDLNFHTEKSKIKIKAHDNQVIRTDEALPKGAHLVYIISGKKGSGKSSLILTALKSKFAYRKYYDNIFMVSPTALHDKKFKKLTDELDEDGHFYDTLNEGTISEIRQKLEAYNAENEGKDIHNLLILDDCLAHLPPAQSKQATLNEMFILSRHLKLSIWVTTQKYNSLNRIIRTQCDLLSFFRTDSKAEWNTLIDDINVDEDKLKLIYEFSTKDSKNDFLHINMLSNPVTYFKKFDKILL